MASWSQRAPAPSSSRSCSSKDIGRSRSPTSFGATQSHPARSLVRDVPAPASARAIAFETRRRVEERGAYAGAVLGTTLPRARLGAADQALATRLVYGTLAWQGR